jgi:hypothetical protein
MSQSDFRIYERLVRERLKNYTHFVYLPIEFDVDDEPLRANVGTRQDVANIIEEYLNHWFEGVDYLIARGSVADRVKQVRAYLEG